MRDVLETARDEVDEHRVAVLEDARQILGARAPLAALAVCYAARVALGVCRANKTGINYCICWKCGHANGRGDGPHSFDALQDGS